MPQYPDIKEGEWIKPIRYGFKFSCCDCGLVHRMDFRMINGKIQFRCFRDNRATGQARRWRAKKGQKTA